MAAYCIDCSGKMTDEEFEMYDERCEVCERRWSKRVDLWRRGADDAELDEAFNLCLPVRH